MKRCLATIRVLLLFLIVVRTDAANVPEMISYQGRLVDGTNLVQGATGVVFRLFDAPVLGAALYAETQTVFVVDGLYSTAIGMSNSVPGALAQALTNELVYLELQIGPTTLSPRERLLAVPYAFHAVQADGLSSTAVLAGDAFGLTNASATTLFGSGTVPTNYLPAAALSGTVTGAVVIVSTNGDATGYSTLASAWDSSVNGDRLYVFEDQTILPGYRPGSGYYESELVWSNAVDREVIGVGMPQIYGEREGHHMILRDSTNITFQGIEWASDGSTVATNINGTFGALCLVGETEQIQVLNCRMINLRNHGIITKPVGGTSVVENVLIDGLYAKGCGDDDYPNPHGVDGTVIADLGPSWTVVNSTFIENVRDIEVWVGHHSTHVDNILIADNISSGALNNSLMLYTMNASADDPQVSNVVIANNIIQSSGGIGLAIQHIQGLIVEGNIFRDCGNDCIQMRAISNIDDVKISGNLFDGWYYYAIDMYRSGNTGVVANAVVTDNLFLGGPLSQHGVYLPDYGVSFRNNFMYDIGAASPSGWSVLVTHDGHDDGIPTEVVGNRIANVHTSNGKYGIRVQATAIDDVHLSRNEVTGMATQNYHLLNTNVTQLVTEDTGNDRVGVLMTSPTTELDVNGTVTATSFSGDGSGLTGISSPWSGAQEAETIHTGDVSVVSGSIHGLIPTASTATNRTWTTDELRGHIIFVSGTSTQVLSDVTAAGHCATFQAVGGIEITLDCNGSDYITLDGTQADAGEAIVSSGNAGDQITLVSSDSTNWMSVGRTGTWGQGTP